MPGLHLFRDFSSLEKPARRFTAVCSITILLAAFSLCCKEEGSRSSAQPLKTVSFYNESIGIPEGLEKISFADMQRDYSDLCELRRDLPDIVPGEDNEPTLREYVTKMSKEREIYHSTVELERLLDYFKNEIDIVFAPEDRWSYIDEPDGVVRTFIIRAAGTVNSQNATINIWTDGKDTFIIYE